MSLNYLEIETIIREMELSGAVLQGAKAVTYESFVINFYKPGHPINLFISLDSECIIFQQSVKLQTLGKPHNLTEFFKAHLTGGVVQGIKQLNNNRIIQVDIITNTARYFLIIRLWGGFSNIIITDENYKIVHLHRKSSKKQELSGNYLEIPQERVSYKKYELSEHSFNSYSQYVEYKYLHTLEENKKESESREIKKELLKRQNEIEKLLKSLNLRVDYYSDSLKYKEYGEIILSNIYKIKKGDKELLTTDYITEKEFLIPLKPELSPHMNSESYFKKYKKARDGIELTKTQIKVLEDELKAIESKIISSDTEIKIESEKNKTSKPNNQIGLNYKSGDWEILVGRNSRENEELFRHYVKGNDMWLHVRDYPGSYVFIKSKKGKTIPLNVLLDAGQIALDYSKGKNNGKGDIIYTQVKYLRRVKKGKPGEIIPTRDKNIFVTLDKKRLEILYS